ncbi:MAG: hypothetical protein OQK94_07515 [Gammaproteobacteria bacterium]|nr:hypothetical protein [Gammaproteobacteria bacterium]
MSSMLQRMLQHSNGGRTSGYQRCVGVRFFYLCLLLMLVQPVAATAEELNEIARLAKGGAAELALKLLEENQPEYARGDTQWLRWERMRVRIMEQRGDWQTLAQHLAGLPEGLPADFNQWVQTRRSRALLLSGQPAQSRQLLRGLLWGADEEISVELSQWRQLVMQSYLHEGRVTDAYVAMLRYQQDYGQDGSESVLIRARILLASGHAAEARSLLEGNRRDRTAERLWWLARLRSGEPADKLLREIRDTPALEKDSPLQQYLHYGAMAEAALAADEPALLILALEQWYRLPAPLEEWNELFAFRVDLLWESYEAYASAVGNREQLLIGNDAAWLKLAEETGQRYPVRKHSLYALLSQQAQSDVVREQAALELAGLLQAQENGMAVVQQLFLHSSRYPKATRLPAGVAYLLVDQAIRDGDLPMASQLLQQLPEPPDNTARFAWQMRRAKVFILAADYASTEALLRQLLPEVTSLDKKQRDQLIQLLFDLQTVGEHTVAYSLLAELYQRVPDLQLRRELLFWMADSRVAQQDPVAAARLYLQSATLIDMASMDPWAQTSRYKAAESLARGGMLADAAYIYSQLLRVTEQPERRAVLRRALEEVRMRQAGAN